MSEETQMRAKNPQPQRMAVKHVGWLNRFGFMSVRRPDRETQLTGWLAESSGRAVSQLSLSLGLLDNSPALCCSALAVWRGLAPANAWRCFQIATNRAQTSFICLHVDTSCCV